MTVEAKQPKRQRQPNQRAISDRGIKLSGQRGGQDGEEHELAQPESERQEHVGSGRDGARQDINADGHARIDDADGQERCDPEQPEQAMVGPVRGPYLKQAGSRQASHAQGDADNRAMESNLLVHKVVGAPIG